MMTGLPLTPSAAPAAPRSPPSDPKVRVRVDAQSQPNVRMPGQRLGDFRSDSRALQVRVVVRLRRSTLPAEATEKMQALSAVMWAMNFHLQAVAIFWTCRVDSSICLRVMPRFSR